MIKNELRKLIDPRVACGGGHFHQQGHHRVERALADEGFKFV